MSEVLTLGESLDIWVGSDGWGIGEDGTSTVSVEYGDSVGSAKGIVVGLDDR